MKQYLDFLQNILDNGTVKKDRTGTGTISLFGPQMEFDLRKGFPVVTTKKLFVDGVAAELLWFLEGSTDERRLAEIQYGLPREELVDKNTIWTANANAQGKALGYTNNDLIKHLGSIYGYNWRRTPVYDSLNLIEIPKKNFLEKDSPKFDLLEVVYNDYSKNDEFIGKTITNSFGTEYLVVEKIYAPNNCKYKLQCKANGYIRIVGRPNLRNNSFGQELRHGRFYISPNNYKSTISYYNKAYNMWYNMTERCYNPNHDCYDNYKHVIIDTRWNDFVQFLQDIESIPFFYNWVKGIDNDCNEWELDKDYYATNMYSKNTCIFIQSKTNKAYSVKRIDFSRKKRVTFPDGTTFDFIFMNDLINKYPDYNFHKESIRLCLNKTQPNYKKCKFEYIEAKEGYVFRKQLVIDQIAEVIHSIKTNPDSRRHIVSAWNVPELELMALPPCHTMFQFYVSDGYLDCKLYQRSADAFLGVPYNITSYSLLLMMVAQVTGLKPRRFIHTFGDAHIYSNHMEQVKEQLTRPTFNAPTMKINENIKNIDDFTMNDFALLNYNCHSTIKAKMAV